MGEQQRKSIIPMTQLGLGMLAASLVLFGASHFIADEIFRYYSFGASTALLTVGSIQLVLAKSKVWPYTLLFRNRDSESTAIRADGCGAKLPEPDLAE